MEVEKRAEKKVAGGKLIRVRVVVDDDKIEDIRITGDFFMHPEEKIVELENFLKGVNVSEVGKAVEKWFSSTDVVVVGASVQDFVDVVREVLK